jgi:alkanesulfonate monooxygenase SsuD/methylene tetrahydromethanopterin reductase-like flavin-dependent oxidoreductase (luciferase family)
MVAVAAIVADDAHEAARLSLPHGLSMLRMRTGKLPARVPTLAEAEAYPWTAEETAWITQRNGLQAVGDLAHVIARIEDLVATTGANEVILVPQGPNLEAKVRTLREVAGAFAY